MSPSDRRMVRGRHAERSDAVETAVTQRQLYRLIYTSAARPPSGVPDPGEPGAGEIAAESTKRNAKRGLTGALIRVQDHFVQVLEGEYPEVEAVFEAICRDLRHSEVKLIDFATTGERMFAAWNMAALDAATVDNAEDYEDLFMGICSGMAPDAILTEMRRFVETRDEVAAG